MCGEIIGVVVLGIWTGMKSLNRLKYDRFVGGVLGIMVGVKSIGFVVGARDCGCDGMNRCVRVESGGSRRRQQQQQGCQFAHAPNVPLPPPCHSHQGGNNLKTALF